MSIILFDTETTGLKPGKICQLSYIKADKNGSTGHNFFFSVDYMEPAAQYVHGFSIEKLEELSDGRTFEDQLHQFRNDFEEADYLIAHNFVFDMLFMMAEYRTCGDVFEYKQRFCTMKHFQPICKFLNKSGFYKYPRLDELLDYYSVSKTDVNRCAEQFFGIDGINAHDARYDTAALYCLMKSVDDITEAKTEFLKFNEII